MTTADQQNDGETGMARFVVTSSNSYGAVLAWGEQSDYQIATPSRPAARALQVQPQNLNRFARKALELRGKTIAPKLIAQRLFHQVVKDVAQSVDSLGTARAWLPGVRALLKSCSNLEGVTASSSQTAQLFEVAKVYQMALGKRGLIDGADLYWHAANSPMSPQKVLIYGYVQPRPDELAWINALAAEDSVLFLPLADSPLFADSQVAVDGLVAQGWQVVGEEVGARSQGFGGDENIVVTAAQTPGILAIGESLSQIFCGASDQTSDGETRSQGSSRDGGGAAKAGQTSGTSRNGISPTAPPPAIAYAYSTLEAEVRGTLAQVKTLLNNGTPARDIAIIARDEVAYGPKLIAIAWEYGVPLRALYQTPLLTTRLGAWLALLV